MAAQLSVGQAVGPMQVTSEEHYVATGVLLEPGATYEISADDAEWIDSTISSTAAGNPAPALAQQTFQGLLRCQEARWFELIGAVGRSDEHLLPIGMGREWTYDGTDLDAELQLFANDAIGFYWNNHGSVGVTIKRLK